MARNVRLGRNPLLHIKLPPYRSRVVMLVLASAFVSLAARAAYLQVMTNDFLQKQGEMRYERTIELPASRGKIVDRNGIVLATSLPAKSIWADPSGLGEAAPRLGELAKLLGVSEAELRKRVADEDKTFVYLKRQVDHDVAERVANLSLPGVHARNEYKRHYPTGEELAHIVGFTNVEDVGQEGMELAHQRDLAGRAGSRRVIRDRLGRIIEDVAAIQEPVNGQDVALSIDSKLQHLAFSAVRDAVREQRAKAGAAVVIDVKTGQVLALANYPTFDPNRRGQLAGQQVRNRVFTDTFEPGSTMKPFTAGLALELGKVTPQTVIQTAPGRLTIGTATIGDAHPHGALTVEEIVQVSSNVGTAKMSQMMPAQRMWEMYQSLGFGQVPQVGFPGAVAGRVRPHRSWKPIEQATMSYGHGISVSLMQLARAYTTFARDGDIARVSMMRSDEPADSEQVFRPETARAVRKMLEMATGPKGTAPKAQIPGYRVAGKTGTAYKQENGRYVKKYIASFVGFAPASDPRLVVAVMVDEPGAGRHYGGDIAAPVFAKITGDALRALRVPPDNASANLVIPVNPVKESL